MLSRVANNLYWMARYIERAGNLARMVDANSQMLLDIDTGVEADTLEFWRPVLEANALIDLFIEKSEKDSTLDVAEFLTLNRANPGSIVSCIANARENARMVRDQISEEMWLELNTLHLFLLSDSGAEWRNQSEDFCKRIVRFSLLFEGIAHATVPRNEGWLFIKSGLFVERTDKTSRILDIPYRLRGMGKSSAPWGTVLRSCSAGSAYREQYGGTVNEWKVITLLVFSDSFPRSIRFSLRQIDDTLRAISGTPRGQYSNEAERITGAALAMLDFAGPNDIAEAGLAAYLDNIQTQLNDISQHFFETYVLLPSEMKALNIEPARSYVYQQQQQANQQLQSLEQQQQQQQ